MNKSNKVATLGLFTALVVVLQFMSYFVKIGTFNLSLVLIPIVIGAVLYGPAVGAELGAAFGIVVTICCVAGLDVGGNILWNINPFLTGGLCILKGAAAGFVAGVVGGVIKEKNLYVACVVSAICVPVVNTGIFCLGMFFCFKETLQAWAGGTNLLSYIIFGLVGINFLIELTLNVVCAPAITRIIKAVTKSRS